MRNRLLAALLFGLALGTIALSQTALSAKDNDAKPAGEPQRIEQLIRQLGSAKFQDRDAASKELEAIGTPAIDALKKAAQTEDLETSKRAGELVRRLEDKAFTAALLAPKRVRLKVSDMPALDAVNELAKISGYPIQVHGDRTKLADKKVTLDTGDVTFWQALEQLCAKAGLMEPQAGTGVPPIPGFRVDPVRPIGPPVQILPVPAPANPGAAPVLLPRRIEKVPVEKLPVEKAVPEQAPLKKAELQPQDVNEINVGRPALLRADLQPVRIDVQAEPELIKAQPVQIQPVQEQAQPVQVQAQPVQVQVQPAQVQPAQAQPIQIQVQIQGQPIQIQPFPAPGPVGTPGQIVLIPGAAQKEFTSHAGSVRVRLLPSTQPLTKGEYVIVLDVAGEPRLQGFSVVGAPSIEKAIDDQGQKLTPVMAAAAEEPQPNPFGGARIRLRPGMNAFPGLMQRQATIRIKGGEKEAKSLKELTGTVTAQVIGPAETLLSLDNVLKAVGQTAKGKNGGSLQLAGIEKMDNGDYKAQINLVNVQQNPFGAAFGNGVIQMQQVQVQVGGFGGGIAAPGNTSGLPDLLDAKGNKFQVAQILNRRMNFNNGQMSQDLTLVFRGGNGQGEPERLVVTGTRLVGLTIPFSFQDVPLSMLGVRGAAPAGAVPGVAPAADVPVPLPPAQQR